MSCACAPTRVWEDAATLVLSLTRGVLSCSDLTVEHGCIELPRRTSARAAAGHFEMTA